MANIKYKSDLQIEPTMRDYMNKIERDISHRHKFIYIHIPKTGGHSLRKVLLVKHTAHAPAHMYIWDRGYFKFTFVRNPYARLLSLYYQYHKEHIHHKQKTILTRYKTFSDFCEDINSIEVFTVEETINNPHRFYQYLPYNFKPQTYWIDDSIQFIGRLESFHKDIQKLKKFLPFISPLNHHQHKGLYPNGSDWLPYYTPKALREATVYMQSDFEAFNYKLYA